MENVSQATIIYTMLDSREKECIYLIHFNPDPGPYSMQKKKKKKNTKSHKSHKYKQAKTQPRN